MGGARRTARGGIEVEGREWRVGNGVDVVFSLLLCLFCLWGRFVRGAGGARLQNASILALLF